MLNSKQFAVQFGKSVDRGREGGCTAFPFMYTFVNRDQDRWDQVKVPGSLLDLADIGPIIPAGGTAQITVILDADHFYKLLYIKYVAWWAVEGGKLFSQYNVLGYGLDTVSGNALYDPILQRVKVNVLVGHNGRYLYGNQNDWFSPTERRPVVPVTPNALQGAQDGWGQVRTPYLLPQNGSLRFELWNENTFSVVVGAMIYGMKVRL
jgi:hypothetical protein